MPEEIHPATRQRRCWVDKTADVLNYLPQPVEPKGKKALHEIWMAETRKETEKAVDCFTGTYRAKRPKATDCLRKDRGPLLAFYGFPAEHWMYLRATDPIKSMFATSTTRPIGP